MSCEKTAQRAEHSCHRNSRPTGEPVRIEEPMLKSKV